MYVLKVNNNKIEFEIRMTITRAAYIIERPTSVFPPHHSTPSHISFFNFPTIWRYGGIKCLFPIVLHRQLVSWGVRYSFQNNFQNMILFLLRIIIGIYGLLLFFFCCLVRWSFFDDRCYFHHFLFITAIFVLTSAFVSTIKSASCLN